MKRFSGLVVVLACFVSAEVGNQRQSVQAAHQEETQAAIATPLLFGIGASGFADDNGSILYRIDPSTGSATFIGRVGFERVSAMDFHPVTGVLYAIGTIFGGPVLITINLTTGAGTEVGQVVGHRVQDISFRNSDGTLFGYEEGRLITINIATGAATVVGTMDNFGPGNGIAFSPTDTLYHANNFFLSTLNQTTGAKTVVASLHYSQIAGSGPRVAAMDFQPGTSNLYGTVITGGGERSATYLATINTTTGDVTGIGRTANRMDALAWQSSPGFDACLQDESSGNILQVNSSNGSYQFTNCRGLTSGGTGTITTKGCLVTLQVNGPDRRVLARIDTCVKTGIASIQIFLQASTFTILDRNTTNNTCSCP